MHRPGATNGQREAGSVAGASVRRVARNALHLYTQVVGKLRLALSPFEPEWANVPLYVTARGLTTSPIPAGIRTIDLEFDFVDHVLVIRSSDGGIERRALGGSGDE